MAMQHRLHSCTDRKPVLRRQWGNPLCAGCRLEQHSQGADAELRGCFGRSCSAKQTTQSLSKSLSPFKNTGTKTISTKLLFRQKKTFKNMVCKPNKLQSGTLPSSYNCKVSSAKNFVLLPNMFGCRMCFAQMLTSSWEPSCKGYWGTAVVLSVGPEIPLLLVGQGWAALTRTWLSMCLAWQPAYTVRNNFHGVKFSIYSCMRSVSMHRNCSSIRTEADQFLTLMPGIINPYRYFWAMCQCLNC